MSVKRGTPHAPAASEPGLQAGSAATGAIAGPLLAWYDIHARVLPWRVGPAERQAGVAPDPYRVWLSEVMLQQTTVAAVKAYFETFTRIWPRVEDLAAAPDDHVMSAWAGLGYYARARNLLACARVVAERHGGRFPETAAALRDLPGIGDYTSAAIASIAFDEPAPVVDGNIERVVTRLFSIAQALPAARALIRARVAEIMSRTRPGDFAQAMMDLGATICTPKKPACILCPLAASCTARAAGTMESFPVKLAKKAKPLRRGAAFVAVRPADGALWLRRRPPSGMLGGMAEPPTTGWSSRADGATGKGAAPFPADWALCGTVSHGFTHFDLELEVWQAETTETPPGDGWWSGRNAISGEALPTLMRKAIALALPDPA